MINELDPLRSILSFLLSFLRFSSQARVRIAVIAVGAKVRKGGVRRRDACRVSDARRTPSPPPSFPSTRSRSWVIIGLPVALLQNGGLSGRCAAPFPPPPPNREEDREKRLQKYIRSKNCNVDSPIQYSLLFSILEEKRKNLMILHRFDSSRLGRRSESPILMGRDESVSEGLRRRFT